MNATNYFEDLILNAFRNTGITAPTTMYIGLFLSDPTETGGGTEIAYSGYARQAIAFSIPAAMETGIGVENSGELTFPTSPSAAGTVTYVGVFDALTTGNMYIYGALDTAQVVGAGEAPVILAGEARWWMAGNFSEYFKTAVLNVLRATNLSGFNPYMGFYNGSPDVAGTELAGTSYARMALSFGAPAQQTGGENQIETDTAVSSARAGSNWGTWASSVITDALTAGNAITIKAKSPTKDITTGVLVSIASGDLKVTVD